MAVTVVIDDLRVFPFQAVYARTSADGVALLRALHSRHERIDTLLLDHDLGTVNGQPDDITPVVDWICERCVWDDALDIGEIVVHSANPAGASSIARVLARFYPTKRVPAGRLGGHAPPE